MEKSHHFQRLGVYGYDAVEPIVLAALVTEDPSTNPLRQQAQIPTRVA